MEDTTPAPTPAPEAPPPPPASTIWRALGEVVAILSTSAAYKFHTLSDLEWMVVPALRANQVRLAHRGTQPVGVVMWAKLDDATAAQMTDPRIRLRPDQWHCGDQVWITDLVHVGGNDPALSQAMLKDVRAVVGAETPIYLRQVEIMNRLRAAAPKTES